MSAALDQPYEGAPNNTYGFYPTWVPNADQWNAMFGYKVDAINGNLTNPVVFGAMTLTQPPAGPNDAVNKTYVDNVLGDSNSLPDAPIDSTPYCRMNASWVPAPTTITASVLGDLVVPGNLSVGLNATILGNLRLGATSNGPYQLDVNGPANFMGAGRFVINSTTSWLTLTANPSVVVAPLSNTHLQIVGADGAAPRIQFDSFNGISQVTFRRAGGTAAAPLALGVNTFIGSINYFGYDGTAYSSTSASFGAWADGAWSPTSHPTRFAWNVTPINTTGLIESMRLANSGNLLIGTLADAGNRLDVVGVGRFWNTDTTRPALIADSGNGNAINGLPTGTSFVVTGPDATTVRSIIASYGVANSVLDGVQIGGTRGAPAATSAGRKLLTVRGNGRGASATVSVGGEINFTSTEAWTDTAHGTQIVLTGTPTGTLNSVEWARFVEGNLLIGTTNNTGQRLQVAGAIRAAIDAGVTSWVTITANAAATLPAVASSTMLQIAGADAGNPRLLLDAYGGNFGCQITFRNTGTGGTAAVPAVAMAANQLLGTFGYQGHDGAVYSGHVATMNVAAESLWTAASRPTRFMWSTTTTGQISTAERMRLTGAGNLLIASTVDNGLDKLQVTGSARVSSGLGMFGHVAPTTQPAFSGSKGGNAALASVIAVLVAMGVATDTTTA